MHENPYQSPEAASERKVRWARRLWWSGPVLTIGALVSHNVLMFWVWDEDFASQFQTQEELMDALLEQRPVVGSLLYGISLVFNLGVLLCALWCVIALLKAGLRYAKRRAVPFR